MGENVRKICLFGLILMGAALVHHTARADDALCLEKVASGALNMSESVYGEDAEFTGTYVSSSGTVSFTWVAVCAGNAGTTDGQLVENLVYSETNNMNRYCWKKITYPLAGSKWIFVGEYRSDVECHGQCSFGSPSLTTTQANNILQNASEDYGW